jgi:hypothetical protein
MDMSQQSHNNPQQPEKQAPNKDPGSQDPNRRAQPSQPGREPYRQPQSQPEREMPKRAERSKDASDE